MYTFHEADFNGHGYSQIRVLQFLNGSRWDKYAYAYVHGLRPSQVTVITYDCPVVNNHPDRVTVHLRNDDLIDYISMEIAVLLPVNMGHGDNLDQVTRNDINKLQEN